MNIDINIDDFLTEDHKKQIENKITKAIEAIDVNVITKAIEKELKEYDYEYITDQVLEAIPAEKITKIITDPVLKLLKNKFSDL